MDEPRTPDITEQIEAFMDPLPAYPAQPTKAIIEAVDHVMQEGPSLRWPILGTIELEPDHRRFIPVFGKHLREIRPPGTDIRILCTFGPDRTLVLLYAGDKFGEWNRWYGPAIAAAAPLYEKYLEDTGQAK